MRSTPARTASIFAVAGLIACVAFACRFTPLGGTLGGFDNDHFVHLLRSDMLLNGEQPLRDFADAELRGAWPSLGYAASAWAQRIWGRTLLAEAYLTAGGVALAAAGVFVLALYLARQWALALLAAAAVIVAHPKLYNYEKPVVLVVALALAWAWARRPSWGGLAAMSAWTAVAALVRHDFGVYAGIAAGVVLVAREAPPAVRASRAAAYVALTVLLLAPSIVWIQRYEGVGNYVQRTLESARMESRRTELGRRPALDLAAGATRDNVIAVSYYLFWAIPAGVAAALVVLVIRRSPDPASIAMGCAVLACAVAVNVFFLRGNLMARFGDAMVPVALAAAWAAGAAAPAAARALPGALLLALTAALWFGGELRAEVGTVTSRIDSRDDVGPHLRRVTQALSGMPPRAWTEEDAVGTLTASQYLAECTGPGDRVLLATYAPEVPFFARRLFAAGQGTFGLAFYESDAQQREAVARLARQSVPVVIGSYEDFEGEFADDYRIVHQWVAERYRDAGTIPVNGRPWFRVLVARDRKPTGVHPVFQLPCFK